MGFCDDGSFVVGWDVASSKVGGELGLGLEPWAVDSDASPSSTADDEKRIRPNSFRNSSNIFIDGLPFALGVERSQRQEIVHIF